MTRTLLAAWGLIVATAVASSAIAAEQVKVIDRKSVAHGAQVDLELVREDGKAPYYRYSYRTRTGIDWVFYREPVAFKETHDGTFFEMSELPELKFNDHRVSLFLICWYDFIVVTLELDPAAPKVYEDRFYDSYGVLLRFVRLVGVDELELFDHCGVRFRNQKLTRDKEGTWRFAGIPYVKKLRSIVSAIPLLPMQELLKRRQEAWAEASRHDSALSAVSEHDPITILPNIDGKGWLRMTDYEDLPAFSAKQERLKGLQGLFSRWRWAAPLAPSVKVEGDYPLPSMTDLLLPPENRADCDWDSWNNRSLAKRQIYCSLDSSRPTVADLNLPCFDTDYDKTLEGISAIYDLWAEYSATRLAKSLKGVYDVGFLEVIEWEMARAGR